MEYKYEYRDEPFGTYEFTGYRKILYRISKALSNNFIEVGI